MNGWKVFDFPLENSGLDMWFLKKLDPKGELSVTELRDLLRQHMLEYRALVLLDHVEPGTMVKKALAV